VTKLGAAWTGTELSILAATPGAGSVALGIFLLILAATCWPWRWRRSRLSQPSGAARRRSLPIFTDRRLPGRARRRNRYRDDSGWIGLPLGAFALHGGLALLLEDSAQRTILPIGRRVRATSSLEADIGGQLEQAEREAGIRRQL
jgi:hypothetical protein